VAHTRVCFVGGGSYNWMPKLLGDLALTPDLEGSIVLHDLNPTAMEDIAAYGRKALASIGSRFSIETTTDLERALDDAEFVVVTITTGGLDSMALDLDIPEKYGIYQSVGDTVGPGGLSRALRNVPVLVGIAQTMERRCPDAWMLNLTNPLTVLTRVVSMTTRIKVMGLCHELFGVRGGLIRMLNPGGSIQVEDFEMRVAGINHLIWILDMTVRGRDGLQMVRDFVAEGRSVPLPPPRGDWHEPFVDRWKLKLALFEVYDALPAAGDRHLAEFFSYFLTDATHQGADYGVLLTRIAQRQEQVASARAAVHAALSGDFPLLTRSSEATADIVSAVTNGRSVRTIVNLPNSGQIDNLPRGAVVETLAEITSAGAQPLGVGRLPHGVLSTLQPHVVNQEMIALAALHGDRRLALQAMVNDPLVPDLATARGVLDELLVAHEAYLPQFTRRVAVAA
jgi:alpha-galactosidase/6-phospho-beta-glucosidase family protein